MTLPRRKVGPGLWFLVTVDHAIFGPKGLAIEERQDIVFLDIPDSYVPPKKHTMPVPVQERIAMSAPLLFRYSAITFNAHRIHYDLEYAREVEHYPGLVVHGPLQASLLMRHATELRGSMPREFSFRSLHPMFAGGDMEIAVEDEDGALTLLCGTGRSPMHGRACDLGWRPMSVLSGMRVVEGSAFVAVPLAGMTLAQMGAEVIRFDRIGGGLDAGRWPLAPSGQSLFWAGMNKGKKVRGRGYETSGRAGADHADHYRAGA